MATLNQKRAARKIAKAITLDHTLTGAEIVKAAGYSPTMQRKPGQVLLSPGVQAELTELGFSEEKAKSVIGMILGDEEEETSNRIKAAQEVFKVKGSYAPEKRQALNLNFEAKNMAISDLEAIRERFNEELLAKLIEKEPQ